MFFIQSKKRPYLGTTGNPVALIRQAQEQLRRGKVNRTQAKSTLRIALRLFDVQMGQAAILSLGIGRMAAL